MKGFFVTGTDTGVGKTVLSALLVAALDRRLGRGAHDGSAGRGGSGSARMEVESFQGDIQLRRPSEMQMRHKDKDKDKNHEEN